MSPPLPVGFRFRLDPTTRVERDGRTLWGGTASRLVRLTDEGSRELALALKPGPLSERGRRLGRRLVTAGLAHPIPPRPTDSSGFTVVIPVRDRTAELDRCLAAVGCYPTIVVDDGSIDPAAVRAACYSHGASLVRLDVNKGPAAARNAGIAAVGTPFAAFLDSDCIATEHWIEQLAGHFDDPTVAAVAPRIRPQPERGNHGGPSTLQRYLERRCPLDMGARAASVRPLTAVPYVPTAALLVRRSLFGAGFEETLRVGEDVDMAWRLMDAGHDVRYDPDVVVQHAEPVSWRAALARRFRYGTSAGPLAQRHPHRLPSLVAAPLPVLIVLATLVGQWLAAAALTLAGMAMLGWRLRRYRVPAWRAPALVLQSIYRFWADALRWAIMFCSPLLAIGICASTRPLAWAAFTVAPYLVEWFERRPRLDPLRWMLARVADDIAYGTGVWTGCLRARSLEPLVPRIARPR